MGAIAGPVIGGHLTGLTGTFGWAFGRDAFASLFAGFIIGFLKRPKEFTKKEDLDKINMLRKNHLCTCGKRFVDMVIYHLHR
jgi:hypothetical protein